MTLSNIIIGELPLVFFTVVAQAAVGLSLLYALCTKLSLDSKVNSHKNFGALFLALTCFGIIASVFHLGDPLHAPYMILRMAGFSQNGTWIVSWLPLEILGIGVMALLGIIIMLRGSLIAIYTLPFVGFLTLFAMSGIYGSMAQVVPTWNFGLTFLLFCASALLLGGFTYRAFFAEVTKEIALSSLASIGGFVLFALALLLYTLHNAEVRIDTIANVFDLMHGYYGCFVGGGLILAGLALMLNIYKDLLPDCFTCNMLKLSLAIVFVGVLATRVAFYGLITTHFFIG